MIESHLDAVSDIEVLPPQLDWSDHAPLSVTLKFHLDLSQGHPPPHHKIISSKTFIYDNNNPLDILQRQIVQDLLTPEAKFDRLYGHPYVSSKLLEVYTDGSCHGNGTPNARAGSGVFWGHDSPKNQAVRVPGKQTNNRSEIFAILTALLAVRAQGDPALKICTDSVYAIKSLVDWAPTSAEKAWKIENGDIIRDTIMLIKLRHGPVTFIQIKGHSNNKHNDAADQLANIGAHLPPVGPYADLDLSNFSNLAPPSSPMDKLLPKVTATFIDKSIPTNAHTLSNHSLSDVNSSIPPHRGRENLRNLKVSLREKLLNSDSKKSF